ncbi:MAG: CHAT domain-containing protein [Saprospiraceae bacterium]
MSVPVILIAFANENYNTSNYLRNLPIESIGLRSLLLKAEEDNLCEFLIIENATFEQIIQIFQQKKYRDRIAVFHFAGHAGAQQLFMNNKSGVMQARYSDGLVSFLASQPALKLVFLNGCHTEQIGQALISAGIPAVIGTSSAILDEVASDLSLSFYQGLTRGLELALAWDHAKDQVLSKQANTHPMNFYRVTKAYREDIAITDQPVISFPWSLSYSPGKTAIGFWSLPQAANNPLFGLPPINDDYDLLNEPFKYLQRYEGHGARNFFGRADYIQRIYRRLNDKDSAPLLLLYGQSGVGKSSLLKAGVVPHLSTVASIIILKRTKENGISVDFKAALQEEHLKIINSESQIQDALEIWKAIEAHTKQSLFIIIDQVEDVFTRPSVESTNELGLFLKLVQTIFKQKARRPKGKLLLSYRKEFHPEIEDVVKKEGLPYDSIFLKKLNHQGIEEVVLGIASTPAHRQKYQIKIEPGLPAIIAADLLKDPNSPVAPVLQILLSNMWQFSQKSETKAFSLSVYNLLQKKGIYLDDFFRMQIEILDNWSKKQAVPVVESGLALDILHYHTTDFGTAESRAKTDLFNNYHHQQLILPQLLQKLKSLYLLSDTGHHKSTLAHDTLAPIIQNAVKSSNRPGQRALRLLETKTIDYELHPEQTFLEEDDLVIVEEGAVGMRAWSEIEQALIKKSNIKRSKTLASRKRIRVFFKTMVALLILAFIAVIYSWQISKHQALGNKLISQALRMEKVDPSIGMKLVEKALPHLSDQSMALQVRHDLFSNNEFYDTLLYFESPINAISISSDGRQIALAIGTEVQIRDTENFNLLNGLAHSETVYSVIYSQDGSMIVTGSADHQVRLWDRRGSMINSFIHQDEIESIAISPDNKLILASDKQGHVKLWHQDGTISMIIGNMGTSVEAVAFSTSGDKLLIGNGFGEIQIRDLDGVLIKTLLAHKDRVLSFSLNPIGDGFISTSRDATIARWSNDGQLQAKYVGHEKRVNAGQWLNNHEKILTASDDNSIRLWNMEGQNLKIYRGHNSFVNDLAVAANNTWFASAGADSTLRVWRIDSKVDHIISTEEEGLFTSLAISEDGQLIIAGTKSSLSATGNEDPFTFFDFVDAELQGSQNAIVWNNKNERLLTLEGHQGRINSVAVAKDGTLFLSGAADGKTILWDQKGNIITEFLHQDEINSVAISPNKDFILSGASDSLAILWNIEGKETTLLEGHNDLVSAVAFSQDGQRLYTACFDNLVRVFDLKGQLLHTFDGHRNRVSCLAISPDGQQVLSGGWDNQIIRWSNSGEILSSYFIKSKNDTGGQTIIALAFSPYSDKIAFTAEGGISQVLTRKGQVLQTITSLNNQSAASLLFARGREQIIIASGAKIKFWKLLD